MNEYRLASNRLSSLSKQSLQPMIHGMLNTRRISEGREGKQMRGGWIYHARTGDGEIRIEAVLDCGEP
jgi:hypothetical protein